MFETAVLEIVDFIIFFRVAPAFTRVLFSSSSRLFTIFCAMVEVEKAAGSSTVNNFNSPITVYFRR